VLTFTTEPLTEPVEWTGQVRAELYVFWTAKDSSDSVAGISDRLRAKGDEASDASQQLTLISRNLAMKLALSLAVAVIALVAVESASAQSFGYSYSWSSGGNCQPGMQNCQPGFQQNCQPGLQNCQPEMGVYGRPVCPPEYQMMPMNCSNGMQPMAPRVQPYTQPMRPYCGTGMQPWVSGTFGYNP
jgi:hypothetical protein